MHKNILIALNINDARRYAAQHDKWEHKIVTTSESDSMHNILGIMPGEIVTTTQAHLGAYYNRIISRLAWAQNDYRVG